MRPIVDIAIQPAGEESEFAGSALLRETAVEVADQRAFFMIAAGPECGAQAVAIGDGEFLYSRIYVARDALNLGRGDADVPCGLILREETLRTFGGARIAEPSEFGADFHEQIVHALASRSGE